MVIETFKKTYIAYLHSIYKDINSIIDYFNAVFVVFAYFLPFLIVCPKCKKWVSWSNIHAYADNNPANADMENKSSITCRWCNYSYYSKAKVRARCPKCHKSFHVHNRSKFQEVPQSSLFVIILHREISLKH